MFSKECFSPKTQTKVTDFEIRRFKNSFLKCEFDFLFKRIARGNKREKAKSVQEIRRVL